EQCDPTGTVWTVTDSCSASCVMGKCTLVSLDITMNQNLDGEIVVDNDVVVHSGVTVTSPTGSLTIRANNITVENMATITATAKGNPSGFGQGSSCYTYCYPGGGGYGTDGSGGGNVFGSTTD